MEAISELTREKTVIMIAHRLKTVRHADQIIVVDKGQVIQRGTHEELLRQGGKIAAGKIPCSSQSSQRP